jgi:hypothetical protein
MTARRAGVGAGGDASRSERRSQARRPRGARRRPTRQTRRRLRLTRRRRHKVMAAMAKPAPDRMENPRSDRSCACAPAGGDDADRPAPDFCLAQRSLPTAPAGRLSMPCPATRRPPKSRHRLASSQEPGRCGRAAAAGVLWCPARRQRGPASVSHVTQMRRHGPTPPRVRAPGVARGSPANGGPATAGADAAAPMPRTRVRRERPVAMGWRLAVSPGAIPGAIPGVINAAHAVKGRATRDEPQGAMGPATGPRVVAGTRRRAGRSACCIPSIRWSTAVSRMSRRRPGPAGCTGRS